MTLARRMAPVLAAFAIVTCGGDDLTTPAAAVVGTYRATTFTATQSGITANLLNLGATLSLTLADGGSATGHLVAPRLGENGSDIDADLSGTWRLEGQTVRLTLPQARFLSEMIFRIGENRLVGDESFGDTRLQITLTRNS
jgi:hypothetical protein